MFLELLAELEYMDQYLNQLLLLKDTDGMKACKDATAHAIKLIKLIKERIEIAEVKVNDAPAPEARAWRDIKLEYEALYHLERLYNNNEDISNL